MAIVAPFNGLTYDFDALDDVSSLMAPPYDVISEEEQEAYYKASPYNIIRMILGRKKTGDTDWDNRYTRSADCFKRWESEQILIRSPEPCMYVTSLTYDLGEGPRVRRGLIAVVRIEEEDSGVILPHERTFSAHINDRLRLMRACRAQFSQIFGLYEDPENRVPSCLEEAVQVPPRLSFDFKDGTSHRMWIVKDQSIFKRVADAMQGKSIFIADGHHRYETSRAFRNMMRTRHSRRPTNRAYEYVMMYLSSMNDIGLTILPSHRLIKRCSSFELRPFLDGLRRWFEVTTLPLSGSPRGTQASDLKRMLEERGRDGSVIGFLNFRDEKCYLFSLRPGVRHEMGEDLHPALKKLDVVVLSRFILQRSLGFSKKDLDNEEIFHYYSDVAEAISLVRSGTYQMAFFLNPTKIEHVKEVASNALVMPRKSTYFYPKVMTGLVFNKIDPYELIPVP